LSKLGSKTRKNRGFLCGKNTTKTGPAPLTIEGLNTKFSLPNGGNQIVNTSKNVFIARLC
jgi:hypothetical protein